MTETQHISPGKVPIQERSTLVGDIIFVNGHHVNRTLLKKRFAEGGYEVKETSHFLLSTRSEAPSTILVHFFAPEEMNADIKHYSDARIETIGNIDSLATLWGNNRWNCGLDSSPTMCVEPGATLVQIHYNNSLCSCQQFPPRHILTTHPLVSFATQYKRICELCVGESFS